MADIRFYHLTSTPLERVLPKLLEKSLQGGFKVRVKMASEEKAEWMNGLLWTYDQDSFLPHGTAKDGNAQAQPVYLTAGGESPNGADLVVVADGSEMKPDSVIKRILDIVDGNDGQALEHARARARLYEMAGHTVSCVRQTATGGWEKQAQ